jgi:ferredoxin--NADP+ reductase
MIRKEKPEDYQHRLRTILNIKKLSNGLFIIRLEKKDLDFVSGQFVILGIPGETVKREYSIYSGESEPFLEVLIREVPDGNLSSRLVSLPIGSQLIVDGPAGDFLLPESIVSKKFLFVASGTGVSPFHSFIKTYSEINYDLLIGLRQNQDLPLCSGFNKSNYLTCMSRENSGDFHGYVTDYLKQNPAKGYDAIYICGNGNMVYDAFNLLIQQGFERDQLHVEIFF